GMEVAVTAGIETRCLVEVEIPRRAMRALTVGWRARRSFDACCCGRVVAMGVSHNNVRDGFVPNRIEERLDMRFVERPRIDDRNAISADNVADRSLKGERPWIVAEQPAHAGIHFLDLPGRKVEALVERDIVTHRTTG